MPCWKRRAAWWCKRLTTCLWHCCGAVAAVILEDSSSISLPNELAEIWRGCGGNQDHTAAAVKLHVRWELKRGRLWGPKLTDGRASDRRSPFNEEPIEPGSLSVKDLGYFNVEHIAARHRAGAYTLTRWQAGTALYTAQGKRLSLHHVLPQRAGQMKQMPVLLGANVQHPMRLLLLKVPKEVGDQRAPRPAGRCATAWAAHFRRDLAVGGLDDLADRCAEQATAF